MTIKASPDFYDYIKTEEGYSAKEYDDRGAGSVGFGIRGTGKKFVTPAEAEKDFLNRIMVAETELAKVITRPNLTQMQQNALVDKHFNMGLTKMREQGFIDLINNGTDEQIAESLKKAVNSRHSQTGVVEKIDALVPRASNRASMWLGTYGQPQSGPDIDFSAMDESAPELDFSALEEEAAPEIDFSAIEEQVIPNVSADFETSLNSVPTIKPEIEQQAEALAKEFGISFDDAAARLVDVTYDDARAKLKAPSVIAGSPKVAEFVAASPNNAELYKKTKDYLPKVEAAAKKLNKKEKSTFAKVVDTNRVLVSMGTVKAAIVYGAIKPSAGNILLKDLTRMKNDNVINTAEMMEVTQAMENMTSETRDLIRKSFESWDASKSALENIIPVLASVKDSSPEFAASLWQMAKAVASNPGALVALIGQTQSPMVAGAAATAAGGAIIGAPVAFGLGGLIAFNESIDKQLTRLGFVDPDTGEIDYEAGFADPNRLKQLRDEALIYSGVMAAGDAAFQLGGGYFAKSISGQGVKKAAKVGAAEAATGFVSEGGSQFLALEASDIYAGRNETIENLAEGFTEGIIGAIAGGGVATAKSGFDLLSHGVNKTLSKVEAARSANEDVVAVSELRAKLNEDEAVKTNPDQVDELVSSVVGNAPEEINEVNAERVLEAEATSDVVSLSPSEFEAFAAKKGIDPLEALSFFSPETQAEYARNRQSDTSVAIPTMEYIRATEEMPELDGLVRFNGNDLNALEANEQLEELERNPFALFDTENLPPVPETETETETEADLEVQTVEDPETSSILRPITLQHQFRSLDEREVFNSLRNKLNRATFKDTVDEKALDLITDLQFRHIRARADFLGVPVKEIAKGIKYKKAQGSARGAFIPSTLENNFHTIAFTPKADARTVVHELSHAWLYEMAEDFVPMSSIPEGSRTLEQEEYFKAMKETQELLGLERLNDLLSLPESQQRRLQEIFANTADTYFAEGNFKNSNIRHLFEMMRKWIASASRALRNLVNTYPTLKMDGRFEFVIDTILGASDKVDEALYPMFEDPMFTEADLGKDGFKAYQKLRLGARLDAQADAYIKAHRKPMRERERELNKAHKRLWEQAEATVDAMESQQLAKDFKEAYESKVKGPELRLSFESVRDVLANGSETDAEQIKKIVPVYMMTGKKKGGEDVSVIMETLGINDPKIMLDLLLETSRRQELVEAEFEKLVKEFEPSLKTDEEIHEIAVEAINGKGREKLILDEFNLLAAKDPAAVRKMGSLISSAANMTTKDLAEGMKANALTNVQEANAYKFTPTKYLNDMLRSRRRASDYFKAGDLETALIHKGSESQQYFNFKEAARLKPKVARAIERISKISKDYGSPSRSPYYDLPVLRYGIEIALNVRNSNEQGITPITSEDADLQGALGADGVKAINAALTNYMHIAKGRYGDNTSVAGMIALGDFIKTVMHQARKAKTLEAAGKTQDVREAAAKFIEEAGPKLNEAGEVTNATQKYNVRRSEGVGNIISQYAPSLINVRSEFESLYPNKEAYVNGVFSPLLEELDIAQNNREEDFEKFNSKIVEGFKKIAKHDTKLQALFAPFLNLKQSWKTSIDKTSRPIAAPMLDYTFKNISEVLTMLLYRGSESSARVMILGRKWGDLDINGNLDTSKVDAFINDAIDKGIITEDHLNIVNTIHDIFREIYPQIAKVMEEVDGIVVGEVQAMPFNTKIGTFKGGYFPLSSAEIAANATTSTLTDLLSSDTLFTNAVDLIPIQNKDFAKNRTGAVYEVDFNLQPLVPYIGAMLNIIHLRKPLTNVSKFLRNKDVAEAIEARRPGFLNNTILPWFQRTLRQEYTEYPKGNSPINALARFIRTRSAVAMYFGAVTSGFKQYFGIAPAMHVLGVTSPKALSWAAIRLNPLNFKNAVTEIEAKSKYMKGRRFNAARRSVKSIEYLAENFDWLTESQEFSRKYALAIIQFNQNIVDAVVWTAAYDMAVNKKMPEDRAVAYADNIVKSTQHDPSVSEMVPFVAGTDTAKLLTSVLSNTIAMHNITAIEDSRDQSALRKMYLKASFAIVGLGVTGVFDAMLAEIAYPVPEEEEEKDPEAAEAERMNRIMMRAAGNIVDARLPGVGRIAMSILERDSFQLSPVANKAEKAIVGTSKALSSFSKSKPLTPYEFAGLMDFFTFVSGLPFSKLGDLNKLGYDSLEPEEREDFMAERRDAQADYEADKE